MKCSCGIGNSYLGIRAGWAGLAPVLVMHWNLISLLALLAAIVQQEWVTERSATSLGEQSKRRRGRAAGGVLVLNSNEETAHNERATSKAYAHSLCVCVSSSSGSGSCSGSCSDSCSDSSESSLWEQRKTAQHESGKGDGGKEERRQKECKENAAEMTKHEIRLRQMQ